MSTLESAELKPEPTNNVNPELVKAAYDIPGEDPRDSMVQIVKNGELIERKAGDKKLGQDQTYGVQFRPEWLNEPKTLDRLKNLDPTKVTDFFSRGLGIRPADQIIGSGITEKDFLQVAGAWGNLERLNIGMTELSNNGLKAISDKFKNVKELHIDGTQINDEGLRSLAAMPNLKKLDIQNIKMSDAGMVHLGKLAQLEDLSLGYNPISDDGLAPLKELKNLKVLTLNDTNITDRGLAEIAKMGQLEHLALSGTAITDRGLTQLKGMPNLKILALTDTDISDRSIDTLAGMQKLEQLIIVDTNITEAGKARLQKLLPNCDINWLPPFKPKAPDKMAKNNLPPLTIG